MSNRTMQVGVWLLIASLCVVLFSLMGIGWLGRGSMLPDAIRRFKKDPIPRIDMQSDSTLGGGSAKRASDHRSQRAMRHAHRPGWIEVGGVMRPQSDVQGSPDRVTSAAGLAPVRANVRALSQRIGVSPAIASDANERTRSVAEAMRSRNYPERLTRFVSPAEFDRDRYMADPDRYLTTIEPGRVFQSAPPAPDVDPIVRLSSRFQRVVQGKTVQVAVRATAGMPVTFYSPALGEFASGLTTITVAADDEGVASVAFRATPGTQGDVDLIASSPVNSSQARFTIHVALPEPIAQIGNHGAPRPDE